MNAEPASVSGLLVERVPILHTRDSCTLVTAQLAGKDHINPSLAVIGQTK